VVAQLDEERGVLEAVGDRLERGRGTLVALGEVRGALAHAGRREARGRAGRAGLDRPAPREDARDAIGDHLVLGRLGEGARVEAYRAVVVAEAELVDLRGADEEAGTLVARRRVGREGFHRLAEGAVVAGRLEDARDLEGRHRMRRIDRPRLAK